MVLTCIVMVYADSDNDEKAKELFEAKCDLCHSKEYATEIKNSEEEWRVVVIRMKDENGADITDEEAETIIAYLAKHYGK